MDRINWVTKLTSRKFWMAVCGLVSGVLLAFHVDENTVTQISGIIMAAASVVAYIIGEGMADAAGARADAIQDAVESCVSGYLTKKEKPPEEDPQEDDMK